MTADRCEPPPGTAPGSVHVLEHMRSDGTTERRRWWWRTGMWAAHKSPQASAIGAAAASEWGWRYVGPADAADVS